MPVQPAAAEGVAGIVGRLRAAGCVFAEDEAALLVATARTPEELADMIDRRIAGLPLEQVLGWAEFCGLRIAIEPDVFVPRRRTEFLIREATRLAKLGTGRRPGTVVVDLCCGSGALGLALAKALTDVELHAVDLEPAAVNCARRNLAAIGGQVYEGDLYLPLPDSVRGRVDVLLANAPYVPTEDVELLPREARIYEPRLALDGGVDGLGVLRRVTEAAGEWLSPGGCLLVETSEQQAPLFLDVVARSGLTPYLASDDELGATVVIGVAQPKTLS